MPAQFEVEQNTSAETLPQVLILNPENKVLKSQIDKTSPSSIKVSYVPYQKGVHLIQLTPAHSEMLEYPVSICDPGSIKILRGYDTIARKFSPGLGRQEETALTFFIGEAGPGKLEAELVTPSGGKIKTDVVSQKEK